MKHYLTLTKMQFLYLFKRSASGKKLFALYVAMLVLMTIMIVPICVLTYFYTKTFNELGLLPELVTLILMASCIMVVLFGIVPMLSTLYFSKDIEFMQMLPVSQSTVYLSKMTIVYLTELIVSVIMILPCIITIGVSAKLGVLYYLVTLISLLVIPMIPLLFISIISIPIMYLVSFFRNKGALSSILLILLFVGVESIYFILLGNSDSADGFMNDSSQVINNFANKIKNVSEVLVPLIAIARVSVMSKDTLFGEMSLGGATVINLLIFLLAIVITLVLSILISKTVYRRGAVRMLENSKNSSKRDALGVNKVRSNMFALISREWRTILRTPSVAMHCLMSGVMCPLLMIVFTIMPTTEVNNNFLQVSEENLKLIYSFIGFFTIAFFGIPSAGTTALSSISREGKDVYMMRVIPLPLKTQLLAKRILANIVMISTIIVSQIVSIFIAFDVINFIFGTLFLFVYGYAYNNLAMYIDLLKPNVNWSDYNELFKGKTQTIFSLLGMCSSLVLIVVTIALFVLIPSKIIAQFVVWGIFIALAVTLAIIFHVQIKRNGESLFNNIEI